MSENNSDAGTWLVIGSQVGEQWDTSLVRCMVRLEQRAGHRVIVACGVSQEASFPSGTVHGSVCDFGRGTGLGSVSRASLYGPDTDLVTVGNILAAQAEADALLRRSCVPPSTGAARVLGDQGRSVALRERPSRQSAEVIAIRSAEQVEVRGSASIVGDDPRRRAECSRACREAGTDRSQPNALIESCYADGSLWFPVDYDGQIGFVSGEFIRGFVEDEPASFRVDAIDVDSEAAPLTVCYPTATTLEVGRVQEFVNIRQAPGFEQDIVATAALGAELTVVNALQVSGVGASEQIRECQTACGHQQSGNQSRAIQDLVRQCLEDNVLWYRVRTDEGLEGYVSGRFLNE